MATATYRFVLPGRYIGQTVTVYDQSGAQVASGAVGTDGVYSVALTQGDYYATTADGRYVDADQSGPGAGSSDAANAAQAALSAIVGTSHVDRSALAKGKNIGGTPVFTQSGTAYRGGYRSMTNTGDYVEFEELLSAGTWTLTHETVTAASGGAFILSVDGVNVSTFDTYIASGGGATRTEVPGLVIASTGKHLVRITVTIRNAAASASTCRVSGYTMTRTA